MRHNNSQNGDSGTETGLDHGRMTLPNVDVGRLSYTWETDLLGTIGVDIRNAYYALPSSAGMWAIGAGAGADPLTTIGVAGGAGCAAWGLSSKVDKTVNTPKGLARSGLRRHWMQGTIPGKSNFSLSSDETMNYNDTGVPIHGIERIYDDGTMEMADGTRVGIIRVRGPNTELQDSESAESRADGLTIGIRNHVSNAFSWYYTTTDDLVDGYVDKYREAAYSERFAGDDWELMREYLHDIVSYEEEFEPEVWDTTKVLTYAFVSVDEDDSKIQTATQRQISKVDNLREKAPYVPDPPRARSRRNSDAAIARQMKAELDTRIGNMVNAVTNAEGVSAERCGPVEVAMLAADYWGGSPIDLNAIGSTPSSTNISVWPSIDEASDGEGSESHLPTPVERRLDQESGTADNSSEPIIAAVERIDAMCDGESGSRTLQSTDPEAAGTPEEVLDEEDSTVQEITKYAATLRDHLLDMASDEEVEVPNISPQQTAMSPTQFAVEGDHLRVGDEYVKTYHVTGWPESPAPDFLQSLRRINGVSFNFNIRVNPVPRGDALDHLQKALRKMGVEISDDPDQVRSSVLDSTEDYYRLMAFLLQSSNSVRPWRISGYLTVRAGEKQALKTAMEQVEQGYRTEEDVSLDVGRQESLIQSEERIIEAVKDNAPGMVIRDDAGMADVLYKSGFPASDDLYNEETDVERTQLCLTGSVGAMFPFEEEVPQDDGGVEYGRHRATGLKMYADQFQRGKAPHKLGIGDSGASKTFSEGGRLLRWWAAKEGRTVVVCDTMKEFTQHVKLTNGNHVEVDGDTTVNPLSISAPTGSTTGQSVKVGDMTFNAAKDWILSVVENQGGNPDDYSQTVEQLLMKTYELAEIDIDDPSTYDNGNPNMADFVETMDHMEQNPKDGFTIGETNTETEEIKNEIRGLKRKLSGFSKLGTHHHMMGEGEVELEVGEFNYLDLSAVESSGAADKSAMLQLMLNQVYELVKQAPEETIFLIDEAHFLLQSPRTRAWLSKSSRHWRHFRGSLVFLTHRVDEFISGPDDPDGHADNIRGQCSTKEFWRVDSLNREHAEVFFGDGNGELNEAQWKYVKNSAVTGESDSPYSTSMVYFTDHEGWYTNHISVGPIEEAILGWDPEDGPFTPYIRQVCGLGPEDASSTVGAGGYEVPEQTEQPAETATPDQATAAFDGGKEMDSSPTGSVSGSVSESPSNSSDHVPRDEHGRFVSKGGGD